MKISNIIEEGILFEEEHETALKAANATEYVDEMIADIHALQELVYEYKLSKKAVKEIDNIIEQMENELTEEAPEAVFEAVQRQFRRYGDKFLRQYRCTTGPKAGRLVSSPEACGKRKAPNSRS